MSEGAVTIRTKKFITNRLLQRKQFVRRALVHSTPVGRLELSAHPRTGVSHDATSPAGC